MGRVSHSVQELKEEKNKLKKEMKKPPSYAEAARRGQQVSAPVAARGAVPWSPTRTFFLQPDDDSLRTKDILAWVFGKKLSAMFGERAGADPPLLRLHRTARGEWQLLLSSWARDQVVASNQNVVTVGQFGKWVLERREVFSGPSAVISRVPLQLSDEEIQNGIYEGARSLLEPKQLEVLKSIRVQRLKRR